MILFPLLVLLIFIYLFYTKDRRVEKLVAQFPGPPVHPIFGNIFNYFTNDLLEMRRRQVATYAKYGEIYRLKLIRSYAISTSDPKVFQKISNSTTSYLTKASDYKLMRPFIGDGLVTGSGLQWQSHRKAIQPAFSINALRQYIEIIDRKSMEMVETLKMHCNRTKINVDKFSKQLTCDIIMETAMGIDTSKRNDKVIEFSRAVELAKRMVFKKNTSYWKRFDILFAMFARSEKCQIDKYKAIVNDYAIDVIQKRRQYLMKKPVNRSEPSAEQCVIDILLQSTIDGQPMSDEEILDEVKTIMIAGQETTSFAISVTLFLLSRHRQVQNKLIAEINEVIGKEKTSAITYQQLIDLKYMNIVIKESLRFYPPVIMIGRRVDQDLELDDGRIIPAGIDLYINFDRMMSNAKYFPNPSVFDPERFVVGDLNAFAYMPFSAGKRDCIGKKFSILSIKTVLCRVLQNFELHEMGDEPIIVNEITSGSINGFQMALTPRERAI